LDEVMRDNGFDSFHGRGSHLAGGGKKGRLMGIAIAVPFLAILSRTGNPRLAQFVESEQLARFS
jgi:hypothetical protein